MKFNLNNPAFLQAGGNRLDKADYFYITSLVDGNELTFNTGLMGVFADNIEYSVNSQEDWEQLTTSTAITLDAQETIYFRNYTGVVITDNSKVLLNIKGNFNAGGDIMRLFYPGQSAVPANGLENLFSSLPIVSAGDLKLTAKTVGEVAYCAMFQSCTSLTTAPELPATNLASGCYANMFYGCTSLTTAPELPATNLAESCYGEMFGGCTSLTTAPKLPATNLAESCYDSMFYGCTSLTTAPELPATNLASGCYSSMFYNCTSLTEVTCLAEDLSANDCTYSWLGGVASSSGTFIKSASMNDWTTGTDGIPTGWTVQDYVG